MLIPTMFLPTQTFKIKPPIKLPIKRQILQRIALCCGLVGLTGCGGNLGPKLSIKVLVGSALSEFCTQSATAFAQTKATLEDGTAIEMVCEAEGSGDIVNTVVSLAEQLKSGSKSPDSPDFPVLISVDGEIYHDQLRAKMEQQFPGQNYIPAITDAPLVANSPMVFMTSESLAPSLQKTPDLFQALVTANTHKDLDAASPAQAIHYVQTAPTRSNSGLQTLVAQFASVSGQRSESLTLTDVKANQDKVKKIQGKITRYGVSTSALAQSMVENGPFWASIGSVYESSVISANSHLAPGQSKYVAVYPKQTFTSNMRGIIPNAPWVSAQEKEAAEKILEFWRSPPAQAIATQLGLRPGIPGVTLGNKFTANFGVDPKATYDSLRPPKPEVVSAMITAWSQVAKKPSLVAIVVDSSGSMTGNKLPAVQNTLNNYFSTLNPQDKLALIDFDSEIRPPVLIDGTQSGRDRGLAFISGLKADGGTRLYDAALFARNWLRQNLRANGINAVLVLTDGDDAGSSLSLKQLETELRKSGFGSDERIAFFTIGYGADGSFNEEVLQQIAKLNGGYYSKGDPATIAQLMADLQLEF